MFPQPTILPAQFAIYVYQWLQGSWKLHVAQESFTSRVFHQKNSSIQALHWQHTIFRIRNSFTAVFPVKNLACLPDFFNAAHYRCNSAAEITAFHLDHRTVAGGIRLKACKNADRLLGMPGFDRKSSLGIRRVQSPSIATKPFQLQSQGVVY